MRIHTTQLSVAADNCKSVVQVTHFVSRIFDDKRIENRNQMLNRFKVLHIGKIELTKWRIVQTFSMVPHVLLI